MAQNWWDEAPIVADTTRPTLKEEDIKAGIGQSEASAASSAATAEEKRATLPYTVRKAAAEATTAEAIAAKGPPKTDIDVKQEQAEKRRATVESLMGEVKHLYKQDIEGQPFSRLGGLTEYISALPENERFTAAGQTMLPLIRPMIAQTAKEGDSNQEMMIFQSYIPSAGDSDITIEQKFKSMEMLLDGMLEGKPPSETLARLSQQKQVSGEGPALGEGPGEEIMGVVTDEGIVPEEDDDDVPPSIVSPDGPNGSGGGSGGSGPPDPYSLDNIALGLGQGMGSVVEGAAAIPGIVANPLGTMMYRAAGYKQPYDLGTSLRESLGLPDNPNRAADAIIQGGAGALGGAGLAKGLSLLAQPGALQSALGVFGAQPGRDVVGGMAAGAGAEFARQNDAGPLGQAAAAIGTGMLGYGGANAATNLMRAKVPTPMARAAERIGVDFLPADTGSPVARVVTNAARVSPLSVAPVVKAARNTQNQLGTAAGRAAQSQGSVAPTDQAGEWLRRAAERYNANTKDIGNTMYRRAWAEAGPLQIPARNAIDEINGMIKKLGSAPETNAGAIRDLVKLRSDLRRGLTAEQMHALRSEISQGVYDGNLRSNTDKGRMKTVRQALTNDMLGYLDSVGLRGPANKIRRADKYWQNRVEQIDQVLQPIVGKEGFKGGEQIVQTIEAMARGQQGGNKRLSRLMANMAESERGEVRSTLIDRLGRAGPTKQNPEGTAFSAQTFVANWNRMTPQAKATLFRDSELRKNLDDIAEVAYGTETSQNMATQNVMSSALQGSAGLQVAWALAHLPSYLTSAGVQFVTGKMMASPKFARWLAKAPVSDDPKIIGKYVDRLGLLAVREPLIRQDVRVLEQHLRDVLGASPPRAAAGEEEQD